MGIQKILHTSILQNPNYEVKTKSLAAHHQSPRVVSAELQ